MSRSVGTEPRSCPGIRGPSGGVSFQHMEGLEVFFSRCTVSLALSVGRVAR